MPSDPIYFSNSSRAQYFNNDIRYRSNYGYSPLTSIDGRNALLLFAENTEIKKAVKAICNEIIISNLKDKKYPLSPVINLTNIHEDKREVGEAIQAYIDDIFWPKLYQMIGFKKDGLYEIVREFMVTGKLSYEIVYDNLKNPNEVVNMIPIDPSTLQKFKQDNYVFYIQRPMGDSIRERILHENQVVLIEWNKFDFGYISYVDQLRRPFNIMRSMQTAKILWFAIKSQVRMHIKLNLGDVSRQDAIQKLATARADYINTFDFNDEEGTIKYNGEANSFGYQEFFTAETAASGTPEIEEINTQGPDLTEVDSLQYWEKQYWKETEIPFDRIDPNSSEVFNFVDVTNMRKIEINFSKFISSIRRMLAEIVLKPIIIQLTLKELEIGIDLNLLDNIIIEWVAFNEYDKLGELELLAKKVEVVSNLATFGVRTDASGVERNYMPLSWLVDNFLDFTPEQKIAMEDARKREAIELGFMDKDGNPIPHGDELDAGTGDDDDINADPEDDKLGGGENDDDFGLDDEDEDDDNPSESDDEGFTK